MNLPPELTGLMWAIALGVVPAAAAVSGLCALCVRRPATRHALWLVVLLLFITPLTAMLPGAPRLPDPINALAAKQSKPALPEVAPAPIPAVAPPRIVGAPAAPIEKQSAPPRFVDTPIRRSTPAIQSTPAIGLADLGASQSLPPNRRTAVGNMPSTAERAPRVQSTPSLGWPSKPQTATSRLPSRPRTSYAVAASPPAPAVNTAPQPPAEQPTQSIQADSSSAAQAVEPPQAAASEVDRYIDRLIGARDAVAAVPPPPGELWLSGVLAILCIAVLRTAWRRRACHDVRPADTETRLLIAACSERIGLRRPPEACFTNRRISPLVTCGARPRIILPDELWMRLDDRARQAVILHELAHLRRGDHWVRWIEQAVTLAYWWHPIIWWVRSRLRHEADLCCDAWVTSLLPSARRAYAEALISTRAFLSERTDPAPVAGLAMTSARAKRFARRLTMVMTDRARPRTSPLGIALALAVAAAGTFVVPTLACPKDKAPTAKASSSPQVIIVPAPEPGAEPAIALGVRSAPTPPAAPRAPRAPRAPKAPKAPSANWSTGSASPADAGSSTFEQYMNGGANSDALRQLEHRLSRLEQGVAELVARAGQIYVTPAPRAPLAAHPSSGLGWAPKAQGLATIAPSDDGKLKRVYVLPEGKLQDLTELMARNDVPILINKGRESITVYASPAQHETFYQFLVLINPEGVQVITDGDEADAHEHEHGSTGAGKSSSMRRMSDAERELARKIGDEARAAVEAHRADVDQLRDQMRELMTKRKAMERAAREMERKSELMREQAERLREEADRAREKRSEDSDSQNLAEIVAQLEAQASEIDSQAEAIEKQFADREHEAESMDEAADQLEEQIDAMVEQIEEMIESAQDSDDDAESDREV